MTMQARRLVQGPAPLPRPVLDAADFRYLADLVARESAIVLEDSKDYLVEARLGPLAQRLGLGGVHDLVVRLRSRTDRELVAQVVDAMATNETSFFRDRAPFQAFEQQVVPRLMEARAASRRLALWSAGCSTGQEPYSLALVLRSRFPELCSWDVSILASDLSRTVLERAADGRFTPAEIARGLPVEMLEGYFSIDGEAWRLSPEITSMVELSRINLAAPTWGILPRFDVVFLRNVLIYFDVATKRAVLERMRRHLQPDGYLFLGSAETTLGLDDGFERVQMGSATCYRLTGGSTR